MRSNFSAESLQKKLQQASENQEQQYQELAKKITREVSNIFNEELNKELISIKRNIKKEIHNILQESKEIEEILSISKNQIDSNMNQWEKETNQIVKEIKNSTQKKIKNTLTLKSLGIGLGIGLLVSTIVISLATITIVSFKTKADLKKLNQVSLQLQATEKNYQNKKIDLQNVENELNKINSQINAGKILLNAISQGTLIIQESEKGIDIGTTLDTEIQKVSDKNKPVSLIKIKYKN